MMTIEKAKRILPSFAMSLAEGQIDLGILRYRVKLLSDILEETISEKLAETISGTFHTDEIKKIERSREQLERFLEATQ